MQELLGKIKIIEDNIKILHRNLIGIGWHSDHPKFAEYYEQMADFEDMVAEMNITLGGTDINILQAIRYYRPIDVREYPIREAYMIAKSYFEDLLDSVISVRESVPDDCQSKLDDMSFWLRTEANYKIKHLLS